MLNSQVHRSDPLELRLSTHGTGSLPVRSLIACVRVFLFALPGFACPVTSCRSSLAHLAALQCVGDSCSLEASPRSTVGRSDRRSRLTAAVSSYNFNSDTNNMYWPPAPLIGCFLLNSRSTRFVCFLALAESAYIFLSECSFNSPVLATNRKLVREALCIMLNAFTPD